MIEQGLTCDGWTFIKHYCNKNSLWSSRKYCRQACWDADLGYEGDNCELPPVKPPGGCTDTPSAWMVGQGYACANFTFGLERYCNTNTEWIANGYCQLSCAAYGRPYDGIICPTAFPPPPSLPPPASLPFGCEDGDDEGLECGGGICRAREYCSNEIFGVPFCDGVLSGQPQFPPWDCLDREPPPWCSACDGEWRLPGPACIPCGAIGGRPYVVEGRSRLPKVVASSEWSYASADPLPAAQENVSCPGVSPFAVTAEVRRLAGQYWVSAGAAEWASVASFSKHSLELIAHGAPAHLLSGVHSAALEEVRHAEAAYAIASSYLGVQVGPSTLETRDSGAAGSLSDLAFSTAREACVAETLAAIEARLTLAACKAPAACAALAVVARDEVPSHGEDYR